MCVYFFIINMTIYKYVIYGFDDLMMKWLVYFILIFEFIYLLFVEAILFLSFFISLNHRTTHLTY
jgi:hypothetical protein